MEDFEREEIRKYLLGGMDDAGRESFEQRVMTDPDYKDAVLMVEDELIEDFIADGLSAGERRDFVEHFLSTPQQLQRLKDVQALHDHFRRPAVSKAQTAADEPARLRFWQRVVSRLWQGGPLSFKATAVTTVLAVVLAVGVLLAVLSWLASSEANWSAAFKEEWGRLNDPQSPVPPSPSAAPVTLTSARTRSGGELTKVMAPAGTESVQVQLRLPPEPYASYRVTLLPVDGDEMFPLPPRPSQTVGGDRVLLLNVPAKLLPRGDYELQLSGIGADGVSTTLDSYNFRLVH